MAYQESWKEREARLQREARAQAEIACQILTRLGVVSVEADYDGAEDAGSIQKVRYLPPPRAGVPAGVERVLKQFLGYELPDRWEINDGSFGTVTLHVPTCEAVVDHHRREPVPIEISTWWITTGAKEATTTTDSTMR
jgi:hypothetical protein